MSDEESAKNAFKRLDNHLDFTHDLCGRIINNIKYKDYLKYHETATLYNKCVLKYLDKKSVKDASYRHNWKNNK